MLLYKKLAYCNPHQVIFYKAALIIMHKRYCLYLLFAPHALQNLSEKTLVNAVEHTPIGTTELDFIHINLGYQDVRTVIHVFKKMPCTIQKDGHLFIPFDIVNHILQFVVRTLPCHMLERYHHEHMQAIQARRTSEKVQHRISF